MATKRYALIIILFFITLLVKAQDGCPYTRALPLIVKELLNSKIAQEAFFKDAGREMYPMYILYPEGPKSTGFTLEGFRTDTTGNYSDFSKSKSVLKVVNFKYNATLEVYQIKLQYNDRLKISVNAKFNDDCSKATISKLLLHTGNKRMPKMFEDKPDSYEYSIEQ